MRKIDVKKLFQRLIALEYELLKYVNRTQGNAAAPLNFNEAAVALSVDKDAVLRACKRLVDAKMLIAEGENFKINEEVYKDEETPADEGASDESDNAVQS